MFHGLDFKEKGPAYAESIKKNLTPFEAFLGDNKWLAGENLTWAGKVDWFERFGLTNIMKSSPVI